MRTFIVIVLILLAILAAVAIYLVATIPGKSAPVQFPPSASHRALLARVPASADSFALIPTAAVFHRKLTENPVTREAVAQWSAEQPLPQPWMLGGADLLLWKSGKTTSYAIRFDPFRASLVRSWMMLSSDVRAVWDGTTVLINADAAAPPIDARTMDDLQRLAAGLPPGDVFAVQRVGARGAYPPIPRPAVSSVRVSPAEILITSRAGLSVAPPTSAAGENDAGDVAGATPRPVIARFPRGALLSVTFAQPPRILGDLRRLLGTDVNALVSDGGSIALYDVDAGTFLPRPRGVIAILADERRRAEIRNLARMAELVGETHDTGREILVSFDRTSLGLYLKDTFEPAPWPANRWAVRIDAPRMVPLLGKLGDSRGLRFASPRFHRAARDLRRWIGALENAQSIVATDSVSDGLEELRVRIASK